MCIKVKYSSELKAAAIGKGDFRLFKATEGSAGYELLAAIPEVVSIKPGERKAIPTGVYLELPAKYEAQIRSRSGLALRHGVVVLNSPGTIDSDFRGELGVILINHGDRAFSVIPGMRIAQLVFSKVAQVKFVEVEELGETKRGEKGFGSTGLI